VLHPSLPRGRASRSFGILPAPSLIARASASGLSASAAAEVGYLPVEITAEGADDPLLAGLAAEQRIMQMHEDASISRPRRAADAQRRPAPTKPSAWTHDHASSSISR